MQRISVVGTTCSGKTTLARRLGEMLDLPHVELDALHWEPEWTPASLGEFRARTLLAIEGDRWVVDGNYSQVRDLVWRRADTIIWLDYALPLVLWRLTRRTFRRVGRRVELWNGNRERAREQLLSRNSLYVWALRTHERRRREYAALADGAGWEDKTVLRFRSPRRADDWLGAVFSAAQKERR